MTTALLVVEIVLGLAIGMIVGITLVSGAPLHPPPPLFLARLCAENGGPVVDGDLVLVGRGPIHRMPDGACTIAIAPGASLALVDLVAVGHGPLEIQLGEGAALALRRVNVVAAAFSVTGYGARFVARHSTVATDVPPYFEADLWDVAGGRFIRREESE